MAAVTTPDPAPAMYGVAPQSSTTVARRPVIVPSALSPNSRSTAVPRPWTVAVNASDLLSIQRTGRPTTRAAKATRVSSM